MNGWVLFMGCALLIAAMIATLSAVPGEDDPKVPEVDLLHRHWCWCTAVAGLLMIVSAYFIGPPPRPVSPTAPVYVLDAKLRAERFNACAATMPTHLKGMADAKTWGIVVTKCDNIAARQAIVCAKNCGARQ